MKKYYFFFSKELKKTRVKALKHERKKHEILRKKNSSETIVWSSFYEITLKNLVYHLFILTVQISQIDFYKGHSGWVFIF